MDDRRLLLRWAAPAVLTVALLALGLARPPLIRASLYDLVGPAAARIPKFVRDASSTEVALIVSSADAARARAVADALARRYPSRLALPAEAIDFLRTNRGGLVAPETARELETPAGRARLARRAVRRLFASPLPPLLGYADDPFGLVDGFVASLAPAGITHTQTGALLLVTNGVTRLLLRHRLAPEEADDLDRLTASLAEIRASAEELAGTDVTVRLSGPPAHTALAAAKSRREIGVLTWFSLAFIGGLSFFVFRSLRWIPLLAGSLLVSSLAGAVALVAAFREIHLMTLVMGTTVLGLVIDYSYHWLLGGADGVSSLRRNLAISFLTTEISLLPLLFATLPVLRQSALFLAVALAAAFLYVLLAYPDATSASLPRPSSLLPPPSSLIPHPSSLIPHPSSLIPHPSSLIPHPSSLIPHPSSLILIPLVGLALLGLCRLSVGTEMTALYRPPPELMEGEVGRRAFREFDPAAFPSLEVRRRIAADVVRLYAEQGASLAGTLQVEKLTPPPEPTDVELRPRELVERIFADWTLEAVVRLALSLGALLLALFLFFGRRAMRVFAPALLALLGVAGVLGWMDRSVNLFHLLAAFLLLGMSVDYAVFLQSGDRAARLPAVCSLLTSVAGFGALAFVSFPVVASFGLVLGLGLPIAFLSALALSRPRSEVSGTVSSASVERGASPLGLEILFLSYRLFGLRALHVFAAAVGSCVWFFSSDVRRASPSRRKLLNFTRSLADKLVVMAEGRRLPRVETDGSADAESFVDDVRGGKGVFVLSSHVGTIEVLTALGACARTFHAWMDFDRTGVFNRFYLHHARRRRVVIHPISSFGLETVFEAGDLIDAGDCLVMAGDRGDGAFRFAAAFDHPVYFVACVAEKGCRYQAIIRRLPSDRHALQAAYERLLAELVATHPDEHFVWG